VNDICLSALNRGRRRDHGRENSNIVDPVVHVVEAALNVTSCRIPSGRPDSPSLSFLFGHVERLEIGAPT